MKNINMKAWNYIVLQLTNCHLEMFSSKTIINKFTLKFIVELMLLKHHIYEYIIKSCLQNTM